MYLIKILCCWGKGVCLLFFLNGAAVAPPFPLLLPPFFMVARPLLSLPVQPLILVLLKLPSNSEPLLLLFLHCHQHETHIEVPSQGRPLFIPLLCSQSIDVRLGLQQLRNRGFFFMEAIDLQLRL